MIGKREKTKRQFFRSKEYVFASMVRVLLDKSLSLSSADVDDIVHNYHFDSVYDDYGLSVKSLPPEPSQEEENASVVREEKPDTVGVAQGEAEVAVSVVEEVPAEEPAPEEAEEEEADFSQALSPGERWSGEFVRSGFFKRRRHKKWMKGGVGLKGKKKKWQPAMSSPEASLPTPPVKQEKLQVEDDHIFITSAEDSDEEREKLASVVKSVTDMMDKSDEESSVPQPSISKLLAMSPTGGHRPVHRHRHRKRHRGRKPWHMKKEPHYMGTAIDLSTDDEEDMKVCPIAGPGKGFSEELLPDKKGNTPQQLTSVDVERVEQKPDFPEEKVLIDVEQKPDLPEEKVLIDVEQKPDLPEEKVLIDVERVDDDDTDTETVVMENMRTKSNHASESSLDNLPSSKVTRESSVKKTVKEVKKSNRLKRKSLDSKQEDGRNSEEVDRKSDRKLSKVKRKRDDDKHSGDTKSKSDSAKWKSDDFKRKFDSEKGNFVDVRGKTEDKKQILDDVNRKPDVEKPKSDKKRKTHDLKPNCDVKAVSDNLKRKLGDRKSDEAKRSSDRRPSSDRRQSDSVKNERDKIQVGTRPKSKTGRTTAAIEVDNVEKKSDTPASVPNSVIAKEKMKQKHCADGAVHDRKKSERRSKVHYVSPVKSTVEEAVKTLPAVQPESGGEPDDQHKEVVGQKPCSSSTGGEPDSKHKEVVGQKPCSSTGGEPDSKHKVVVGQKPCSSTGGEPDNQHKEVVGQKPCSSTGGEPDSKHKVVVGQKLCSSSRRSSKRDRKKTNLPRSLPRDSRSSRALFVSEEKALGVRSKDTEDTVVAERDVESVSGLAGQEASPVKTKESVKEKRSVMRIKTSTEQGNEATKPHTPAARLTKCSSSGYQSERSNIFESMERHCRENSIDIGLQQEARLTDSSLYHPTIQWHGKIIYGVGERGEQTKEVDSAESSTLKVSGYGVGEHGEPAKEVDSAESSPLKVSGYEIGEPTREVDSSESSTLKVSGYGIGEHGETTREVDSAESSTLKVSGGLRIEDLPAADETDNASELSHNLLSPREELAEHSSIVRADVVGSAVHLREQQLQAGSHVQDDAVQLDPLKDSNVQESEEDQKSLRDSPVQSVGEKDVGSLDDLCMVETKALKLQERPQPVSAQSEPVSAQSELGMQNSPQHMETKAQLPYCPLQMDLNKHLQDSSQHEQATQQSEDNSQEETKTHLQGGLQVEAIACVQAGPRVEEMNYGQANPHHGEVTTRVQASPEMEEASHMQTSPEMEEASHMQTSPEMEEASHVQTSLQVEETSQVQTSSQVGEMTHVQASPEVEEKIHVQPSSQVEEMTHVQASPEEEETTHVQTSPEEERTTGVQASPEGEETTHVQASPKEVETTHVQASPEVEETTCVQASPRMEVVSHMQAITQVEDTGSQDNPLLETNSHLQDSPRVDAERDFQDNCQEEETNRHNHSRHQQLLEVRRDLDLQGSPQQVETERDVWDRRQDLQGGSGFLHGSGEVGESTKTTQVEEVQDNCMSVDSVDQSQHRNSHQMTVQKESFVVDGSVIAQNICKSEDSYESVYVADSSRNRHGAGQIEKDGSASKSHRHRKKSHRSQKAKDGAMHSETVSKLTLKSSPPLEDSGSSNGFVELQEKLQRKSSLRTWRVSTSSSQPETCIRQRRKSSQEAQLKLNKVLNARDSSSDDDFEPSQPMMISRRPRHERLSKNLIRRHTRDTISSDDRSEEEEEEDGRGQRRRSQQYGSSELSRRTDLPDKTSGRSVDGLRPELSKLFKPADLIVEDLLVKRVENSLLRRYKHPSRHSQANGVHMEQQPKYALYRSKDSKRKTRSLFSPRDCVQRLDSTGGSERPMGKLSQTRVLNEITPERGSNFQTNLFGAHYSPRGSLSGYKIPKKSSSHSLPMATSSLPQHTLPSTGPFGSGNEFTSFKSLARKSLSSCESAVDLQASPVSVEDVCDRTQLTVSSCRGYRSPSPASEASTKGRLSDSRESTPCRVTRSQQAEEWVENSLSPHSAARSGGGGKVKLRDSWFKSSHFSS